MSKKQKRTGYPLNSTRRAAAPAETPATAQDLHSFAADHHADDHKDGHHGDHHGGDHHGGDHHKDDHSQN